ncbi:MAG: menaquinone biosynthetic enzyme MqnA/MqnD family protein [Phycisphaerales bacterium]
MATPTTSDVVKLGCVSYLNTLPLIEGLEKTAGVGLDRAAPARLIDLLTSGQVEAGLISLIDAQRSAAPLALMPCGMIGCDGATLTVRLYSTKPIGEITRVHVDAESHTAVALLRVLLARVHGVRAEVVEFDARERVVRHGGGADDQVEWPEALLLIGDKVVTQSPPAVRYPHQMDLGEGWKEWAGLPFVYAAWMCRAEDAESERMRATARLLDRQRRRNGVRADRVATGHARERGWPEDLARDYLGRKLRFDPEMEGAREAVERFFDEAFALGLIAERRETVWMEMGAGERCLV